MKITYFKLKPGELMMGGRGVMSLNSAKWDRKQPTSGTDGSPTAPPPGEAEEILRRLILKHQSTAQPEKGPSKP